MIGILSSVIALALTIVIAIGVHRGVLPRWVGIATGVFVVLQIVGVVIVFWAVAMTARAAGDAISNPPGGGAGGEGA